MDITTKTDVELKALAYDELVKKRLAQANIELVNNELARRNKPQSMKDMIAEKESIDGSE